MDGIEILLWILAVTFIDGLAALVGILALAMGEKTLRRIINVLVAFAAGTMIGGGLLHLLAKSLESLDADTAFIMFIAGFSVFFLIERILHWHHCHDLDCKVHEYSYLVLIGDGIHNFIDGLVIAAAFLTNIQLGVVTSILIIGHEIPQEIGDFAVLLQGGMEKKKAVVYNFISQITAILGGVVGFLIPSEAFKTYMLPIAAGGFIYIAASDLVPELHKEPRLSKALLAFSFFLIGVVLMLMIKVAFAG